VLFGHWKQSPTIVQVTNLEGATTLQALCVCSGQNVMQPIGVCRLSNRASNTAAG